MKTNLRIFAATLAVATIGVSLTACDNNELTTANAKLAKLETTVHNQAAVNDALTKDKAKVAADLALEKAKTADLSQKLAAANTIAHKERVAKNHLIDQVRGAKAVAGTAVDRAHAKGVKDAQVAAANKQHQKVPAKKS